MVRYGRFLRCLVFVLGVWLSASVAALPERGVVRAQGTVQIEPARVAQTVAPGMPAAVSVRLTNTASTPVAFAFPAFAGGAVVPVPPPRGYDWVDSTDPNGPVFEWRDVRPRGQVHALGGRLEPVALPFPFPFLGTTQTYILPAPQGYLAFGGEAGLPGNMPLPSPERPNGIIAPFWDDLVPGPGSALHTHYDPQAGVFVVQYTAMAHRTRPGRFTFQALLYPDGDVVFQYLEVGAGAAPVVGVEGDLGLHGVTVSRAPEPGLAIRLDATQGFAHPVPAAGVLPPGGQRVVTVQLDPAGLAPGAHTDVLSLVTDLPAAPRQVVLATLTVDGPAAQPFRVSPAQFEVTLDPGATAERTLVIENTDPAQAHAFRLAVRQDASPPAPAARKGTTMGGKQRRARPPAALLRPAVQAPFGYASDVLAATLGRSAAARFVRFGLGAPATADSLAPLPVSFAADFAFGETERLYLIAHEEQAFYAFDLVTGHRVNRGLARPRTPAEVWTDLATDPTDGTLYGVTIDGGARRSFLYRIDPADGTPQHLGEIDRGRYVMALAVDASGQLYALDLVADVLLAVEKSTGAARTIGKTGYSASEFQSMDFDPATGTLYLAAYNGVRSELRTVDPLTGETMLVGPFGAMRAGFLALPSGTFVTPETVSATVPPGGQRAVTVTFDAGDLVAGTYRAVLAVGAAGLPSLAVPVVLHVRGRGQIELRRSSLDFGAVYAGSERALVLSVRNVGTDTLRVGGVRVEGPSFALSEGAAARLPLSIAPGAQEVLSVVFRPVEEGALQGTLTLESDDPQAPSLPVALSGLGRAAPQPVLEPGGLTLMLAQGSRVVKTLRLENTGPHPFTYALAVEDGAFGGAVEPPLLVADFGAGLPPGWVGEDRAEGGVGWTVHTAFPEGLMYENWTGGRGPAAMVSSHAAPGAPFDAVLRTPPLTAPASNLVLRFLLTYIDDAPGEDRLDVEVTTDGGRTWVPLRRFDENVTANPAVGIFMGPGRPVTLDLAPHVARGDVFQLQWRYHHPGRRPEAWYAQIDDVAVGVAATVLTASPAEGTLAPGAVQEVALTFDTDGLVPGVFETQLRLVATDPLVPSGAGPSLSLPVTLNVLGGASLSLSSAAVRPLEVVEVPLYIQGRLALETFAFTLAFDPDLIEVLGVETEGTVAEGAALAVTPTGAGRLAVATQTALPAPVDLGDEGEAVLLRLRLRAADRIGRTALTLPDVLLNGLVAPTAIVEGGLNVVPLYGDVTYDGVIDGADVHRLARHILGVEVLRGAARTSGDVTGDGRVTFHDAALVRRYLAGTLGCFPADPACTAPKRDAPATAQVRWGAPAPVAGGRTGLPVVVEQSDGPVTALALTARLAPGTTVEDVAAALPAGWDLHWHVASGRLHVGLFGPTPLGDGTPARLILDGAALPEAEVSVNEQPPQPMPGAAVPEAFTLDASYPNPFTRSATIPFALPTAADVSLVVYNLLGQPVRTLVEGRREAGRYTAVWDGRTDGGAPAAAGPYVYRLHAGGYVATRRLLLVK